jgi:hypothetical protein
MASASAIRQAARAWLKAHRREALDLVALGAAFLILLRLGIAIAPAALACALLVAVVVPLPASRPGRGPAAELVRGLPRMALAVALAAGVLHFWLNRPLDVLWFGAAWPVAALLLRADWPALGRRALELWSFVFDPVAGELLRCALLAACGLALMAGFFRATRHGTEDAYWYALNLADTVAQVRSGVFPVFAGQSIFQFNGSLCPIRVAPAFSYLGALLDLATFHRMGTFALQNLLITLLGVASLFSAYLCLRAMLPLRRWLAAGLALLYLACPGVLGIAYNTDLYMSWTTAPLIPVVWYATVRSFGDRGAAGTLVLLGAALGLCWWGHPPIALWATLLAGACQAARLASQGRPGFSPGRLLCAAAAFAALAAYPIGSVLLYPPEPGGHTASAFQRALAGTIADFVREAHPAALLPLSPGGRSPGDFQMGYALWALLGAVAWAQRRSLRRAAGAPLACALLLALLILPIPGVNRALWSLLPKVVLDTTGNWAMPRLCLQLAAAIVFATAGAVASGGFASARPKALAVFVALGCVWSLCEAGQFIAGSLRSVRPPDSAVDDLRPENLQLTRYSYSMFPHFPGLPTTFTHGSTDPELENRLLSADMKRLLVSDSQAALASATQVSAGEFRWDPNPQHAASATLEPVPRLEPGLSYMLAFDFSRPGDLQGVLKISGRHLLRIYGLPEHGGPDSFGAGGSHPSALSLWSTAGPEAVTATFFPAPAGAGGQPEPPVGSARLLSFDRASLPVRVQSWIPFRASVRSPAPAWLETPRAFQTGYAATVDGRPASVRESPNALVAVEVPEGASRVVLAYAAPAGLRALFWLSLAGACALALAAAVRPILPLRQAAQRPSHPLPAQ